MEISDIEKILKIKFPPRHKKVLLNKLDAIHEVCDILMPTDLHDSNRIVDMNLLLRHPEPPMGWPDYLVAFASNGCGDYFAYDLRTIPLKVIYIDPDSWVLENLNSEDKLVYPGFDAWYDAKIQKEDPEVEA